MECTCTRHDRSDKKPQFIRDPACPLHGHASDASDADAEETMRRKLSEALGLDRLDAPSWDDLLLAARKPRAFSSGQVVRLAYLTGCERVPMDRLGDAMIEVLESGVASKVPVDLADELRTVLGAPARTTWAELLQHVGALAKASPALGFRKLAFRIREGKAPDVCSSPHPDPSSGVCSLLEQHFGPHWNSTQGWWQPVSASGRAIVPTLVERLDGAFAKLARDNEKLTRDDDRIGALELAHDSLEQRLLAEIERRFKTVLGGEISEQLAKVFAGMKTQNERLAAQDEKLRDGLSRVSGHAAQLERLEGWRTRVSKQFGPDAGGGPVNGAILADLERTSRERDEAVAAASRDVLASASEVFKKLEQGLLSLDRDVVSTNKRIDEALVKGKERGDEIRGRLAELEAFRSSALAKNPWLTPPPPVALEPLSADELARAKSIDGSGS